MKKILLFLCLLSLSAFADGDYSISKVFRYKSGDTFSSASKSSNFLYTNDFNSVQLVYSSLLHAVPFDASYDSVKQSDSTSVAASPSVKNPIRDLSTGSYIPYNHCPLLSFVDNLAAKLVYHGFTMSPEFVGESANDNYNIYQVVSTNGATVLYNLASLDILSSAMFSTNTVFRQMVLSSLSSLDTSLRSILQTSISLRDFVSGIGSTLSSVSSSISSFSDSYDKVNYANLLGGEYSESVPNFATVNPLFSRLPSGGDFMSELQRHGGGNSFDDAAMRSFYNQASVSLISDAMKAAVVDPSRSLSSYLSDPLAAQSVLSYSYSTPLTNAMNRMTADWRDAVTNELAQNTANITNQLEQWKRDSNLRHNDTTNALDKVGQGVSSVADDAKRVADMLSGSSASKAHVIVDNEFIPVEVLNWPEDLRININANDLDVLANASGVSAGKILDALTNRVDALTNSVASLPVSLDVITNLLAKIDVDMLDNLTNLDFNVSLTNDLWNYYFTRFRRANEFEDENGQRFRVDTAADSIFGNGFDAGEFGNLNWFSRVEVLLYQVGRVFDSTNAIESVDIETALDDTVDQLEEHGADFVAASRRVVGLFSLVDRFAKSMKLAFGSYSNPVTSGILLLPSGSWIGNHALVLEIPVSIQNALRLVFQCIWYLSAFVIGWRVVSSVWSRVVSFVRWLWSLIDV